MSKLSKWPFPVFLCGVLVHVEKCGQAWLLLFNLVIHLCPVTPGPGDAACCSSFIQSALTGWVCVDLGRSPGCLLLRWDGSRSPQTQFEIIKRVLVEMWEVWSHTLVGPHRSRRVLWTPSSLPNLLSRLRHTHLRRPITFRAVALFHLKWFHSRFSGSISSFTGPVLSLSWATIATRALPLRFLFTRGQQLASPCFASPCPEPPTSGSHLNDH